MGIVYYRKIGVHLMTEALFLDGKACTENIVNNNNEKNLTQLFYLADTFLATLRS